MQIKKVEQPPVFEIVISEQEKYALLAALRVATKPECSGTYKSTQIKLINDFIAGAK